jgi:LPPG:FO 2-phospho-L-lactate transferase
MRNYLLLCGGVGGAKLALGFSKILPPSNFTIVVNTGDDFTHLNLKICPDLDTVLYTLSEESDLTKGWGRKNETWQMLSTLKDIGGETWFQLGDKDIATHIMRTNLINEGASLSEVTKTLCKAFKIAPNILPMSNESVKTYIQTKNRLLSFQEYFVKFQCEPPVTDFVFKGLEKAKFNSEIDLDSYDEIIICPSNPFVSINPIIQLTDLNQYLKDFPEKVSVVSPIVNSNSLKGPTSKMMNELGMETSVVTIAKYYSEYARTLFIDTIDHNQETKIINIGYDVSLANLVMNDLDSKISLAQSVIDYLEYR